MPDKKEENILAQELAKKQKEISISEFFEKNKHLLGFDNPKKALLTTIKEAVDNSLDACQEMKVLPEIKVEVEFLGNDRFKVSVEDNGPGIIKQQIPNIFAKLLYGSKFHAMKQSLTADEPIMIQRDNKIEIVSIGEFIDSFLKNEGEKDISNLKILVPTFDKNKYSYSFRQVSHVIKHKRQNEILKITTTTNREIKVTGCHSLFTQINGQVKEIEARNLKEGDSLIVPKKLPEVENIKEINILDYISLEDIEKNWFYVYNISNEVLNYISKKSKIIHKKTSKSRRFYRIGGIEVLDDSFKQYKTKKFLPLNLVLRLGLKNKVTEGIIKTYYHGKETKIPVTIPLTKDFIKFLGLYVAEGHHDKRQIGLTLGKHEDHLIKDIVNFAQTFGLNFTIENRENSIRIKIFGNIFVKLIKNLCGKLAKNKKIPEFIFRINQELRQDFLDALYLGDGHNTKNRNQLMLCTISKKLANEVLYLWLMQGIHASIVSRMSKGLGKIPTLVYIISLYGSDINKSNIFSCNVLTSSKRNVQQILQTDLALLKIRKIERINEGYEYVYDLSVPECENFVGGLGGLSCHNSRGQQGIGISAAVLYSQLTTGKPAKIISKISPRRPAHYYELNIDTRKNEPDIIKDEEIEWDKDSGIKIEIELEAQYQKGKRSVDEYLKQTAIVNPHLHLTYINPEKEKIEYPRVTNEQPKEPKEIRPHPYGIEIGILIRMLKTTNSRTLQAFLIQDFSRISSKTAKEICEKANLQPNIKPQLLSRIDAEHIMNTIKQTKIMAPPTNCLSPIGQDLILKGLKKEINADFYASVTRSPSVYRGMPFQVEVGIAYGGNLPADDLAEILRFANRVPLLYEQSACATTKSIISTIWRNYGLSQSKSALPQGPCIILVHICSVWVPYTSESKEAIASYPEIVKEIKLALQECGRKLSAHLRHTVKAHDQREKINLFEKYIPEVANALHNLSGESKNLIIENLNKTLKKSLPHLEKNGGKID